MKPDIWGKHMWYTIHFVALAYPHNPSNEDKRQYQVFFENLHHVIPCYKCSVNYISHLNEKPITVEVLSGPVSLFRWTVDIHNLVNKELKKKQWKYTEAHEFYENFERRNISKNKWCTTRSVAIFLISMFALICGILLSRTRIKRRR